MDIQIEVSNVDYTNLKSTKIPESSSIIKNRVNNARKIQIERYKKYNIFSNSSMTPRLISEFCKIDNQSEKLLKSAFERLGLSARAYTKILKVARTIADLEQKENIEEKHIAEAIQYRSLDRKYWQN
jgi:magnesium chelatase family protein